MYSPKPFCLARDYNDWLSGQLSAQPSVDHTDTPMWDETEQTLLLATGVDGDVVTDVALKKEQAAEADFQTVMSMAQADSKEWAKHVVALRKTKRSAHTRHVLHARQMEDVGQGIARSWMERFMKLIFSKDKGTPKYAADLAPLAACCPRTTP